MKHKKVLNYLLVMILLGLVLSACSGAVSPQSQATSPVQPQTAAPVVLNVMTYNSFSASQDVIDSFQKQYNIQLKFLKSGDTGAALNKAILSKNAPLADVFFGVDNTFLSRALSSGIFLAYKSPLLNDIPDKYKLDPSDQMLPVDHSDVCLVYDKAYFQKNNLPVPQSFDDLLKPEYKNLLVVENPATSSPGLAFLLATIAHYGPDKYLDFWMSLKNNGVVVVDSWDTAYYTDFSGSSGKGPQPLVVSYDTDPAAEIVFSTTPITVSPVGAITAPQMCFQQVEFVGILKGTQHLALAQKLVDFMMGVQFQEDMPLQMYVFPVNSQATLPDVFNEYVKQPEKPATLSPDEISQNRDAWIKAWTQAVLQ